MMEFLSAAQMAPNWVNSTAEQRVGYSDLMTGRQ